MRCLAKNKQNLFYALYTGISPILDADGLDTGDKQLTYTAPKMARMNISPASGNNYLRTFGDDVSYSHVLMTDDMKTPFDAETVWWIGIPTSEPHNYKTVRVARSLNVTAIAVQKIDVS